MKNSQRTQQKELLGAGELDGTADRDGSERSRRNEDSHNIGDVIGSQSIGTERPDEDEACPCECIHPE